MESSKSRYPDIDRGWAWVVMGASYVGIVLGGCYLYMCGIIYVELLHKYQEGQAKTSLVGSLCFGVLCWACPMAGALTNRFGSRITSIVGGFILAFSNVASAFCDSLDILIFTAGALPGIGYACFLTGSVVSLGYYFQERRDVVISGASVMLGAGLFVASPLALLFLHSYGLNGVFLMMGGLNLHLCVAGLLSRPSSTELAIHQRKSQSTNKSGFMKGCSLTDVFNLAPFKSVVCVFFLTSTACWNFALNGTLVHLPNFMEIQGFTEAEVAVVMTALAISNLSGRLLGALLAGKGGEDNLLFQIGVLGVCGILTILFPFYSALTSGNLVFAIQLGLYVGCPNGFLTALAVNLIGEKLIAEAHGLSYLFCGIGGALGPVVAGVLFGSTGTYDYSFVAIGLVLLIGCASAVAAEVKWQRTKVPQKDVFENHRFIEEKYHQDDDEKEESGFRSLQQV